MRDAGKYHPEDRKHDADPKELREFFDDGDPPIEQENSENKRPDAGEERRVSR